MRTPFTLLAAALTAFSAAAFAQTAASPAPTSPAPPASMPMMHSMRMDTIAKIKADLQEAQGAAQAQGDKVAQTRISDALRLLDQLRQPMPHRAEHMMMRMRRHMRDMNNYGVRMRRSPVS
jgi:hypothetical protein